MFQNVLAVYKMASAKACGGTEMMRCNPDMKRLMSVPTRPKFFLVACLHGPSLLSLPLSNINHDDQYQP